MCAFCFQLFRLRCPFSKSYAKISIFQKLLFQDSSFQFFGWYFVSRPYLDFESLRKIQAPLSFRSSVPRPRAPQTFRTKLPLHVEVNSLLAASSRYIPEKMHIMLPNMMGKCMDFLYLQRLKYVQPFLVSMSRQLSGLYRMAAGSNPLPRRRYFCMDASDYLLLKNASKKMLRTTNIQASCCFNISNIKSLLIRV